MNKVNGLLRNWARETAPLPSPRKTFGGVKEKNKTKQNKKQKQNNISKNIGIVFRCEKRRRYREQNRGRKKEEENYREKERIKKGGERENK